MVMVRTPLRFNVAPPGSSVCRPDGARARRYRAAAVRSREGRIGCRRRRAARGTITLRAAAANRPREAGSRSRSRRASRSRRTRCGCAWRRARDADATVEWSRKVGAVEATFDCTPGDFDEHGRIRMKLEVESQDPTRQRDLADQRPRRDDRRHADRPARADRARRAERRPRPPPLPTMTTTPQTRPNHRSTHAEEKP